MDADHLRGHLDAVLLSSLESGPAHGYALIEELRRRTSGSLSLPTGTVYPALRRLERAGLIEGEWATVDGRRRRTYRITARGVRELAAERTRWKDFVDTVDGLLGAFGPLHPPRIADGGPNFGTRA